MNPTEAIYGFAAWLTCRPGTLLIGSTHNAAPMAELCKEWVKANSLPEISDDYPDNIIHPVIHV